MSGPTDVAPDGHPWPHTNLADFLYIAAQQVPDRICIETDSGCYTYAQMVRMVESVRLVLRRALSRCPESQIPPIEERPPFHQRRADEHAICIVLDRGPECLAAVHATMLEGCVYNTFDAAEPREKLKCWVEIAQHPLMITSRPVMDRLGLTEQGWSFGGDFPRFVLDIHEVLEQGEDRVEEPPPPQHRASDLDRLCYVIFTSGSTGKPKAVMIEHRSACNLVRVWSTYVGLMENDRCAQMASMAFDNHVPEVYGAMFKMCTSVVVPDLMKRSGPDMLGWLADKQVNLMVTVPSHLRSMLGPGVDVSTVALPHLRVLDIGGEALGRDVLDAWAPGRNLFNIYGPTEITVVCCGIRVEPGDEITIGYDLPTYTNKVLNMETLQPCAVGERGVLYTGGIGTARGYLDDEDKTNSKFVHVPALGMRMYCSGDVVSQDASGRLHYHGRADWQVKVRGIRIELEALEEAVGNLPGVKHCESRVIDEGRKLVMIASGPNPVESEIKDAAAKLGKGYMLNMVKIVDQSAWKFNTSGKLVRNHVQLDDRAEGEGGEAPKDSWTTFQKDGASEIELDIAACVAQLVTAETWNTQSHFIEDLGLDSAGFGKLITLLRRKAALSSVDLPTLFENPTVALLAGTVESEEGSDSSDESDIEGRSVPEAVPSKEDLLHTFLARCVAHPMKSGASSAATKLLARTPIPPQKLPQAKDRRCHALCVEGRGAALTYTQVYHMALAIQALLRKAERAADARPEDGVGAVMISLEAQAEYVASMVAVLLEKRAFCVVEPGISADQFVAYLEAVKASAVIAYAKIAGGGALQESLRHLSYDCALVDIAVVGEALSKPLKAKRPRVGSSTFCCVAFTGGSTGKVKASIFEHSALGWAARTWHKVLDLTPQERVVQLQPPSEIERVMCTWATIDAGGALLLPPLDKAPGSGLRAWLTHHRATALGATTEQLRSLGSDAAAAMQTLRLVWVLRSRCDPAVATPWAAVPGRRFVHGYLRPEVLGACALVIEDGECMDTTKALPYGSALSGCQLHLLDENMQPVSYGREGRLYISSPGLAGGFLGEFDEDKLLKTENQGLLYATGEVAKMGPTGVEITGTVKRAIVASRTPSSRRSMQASNRRRPRTGSASSLGSAVLVRAQSFATAGPTPRYLVRGGSQSTFGTFANYLIESRDGAEYEDPYGEDAYLMLSFLVQSLYLLVGVLAGAFSEVFAERFLYPWSIQCDDLRLVFVVTALLPVIQRYVMAIFAIILKWALIGKYRPGTHSIYSTFYLKHWIVEQIARKSILGGGDTQGGWNFSIGANFLKVVALNILGAKISLSAQITTQVTGYDLISVGPLASVHGPYHLTGINYIGKRMVLGVQKIGCGATLCHQSCVAAGAEVKNGAFVEPLTVIPPGAVVEGRWTGVPGRQIGPMPVDRSRASADADAMDGADLEKGGFRGKSGDDGGDRQGSISGGCCGDAHMRMVWVGALFAFFPLLLAPLGYIVAFLGIWLSRQAIQYFNGTAWKAQAEQEMLSDDLPPIFMDNLWVFMVVMPLLAIFNEIWSLLAPVVVCKILPKAPIGMDLPLFHPRALIAAMKIGMVTKASNNLGDASIQAWYLRRCGAKIGKGSSMSEQTLLPETVEIGENVFFASGNTLTSMEVDQGRMRILARTTIGSNSFFGNENHVSEGVLPGTFVGLRTWVPKMPCSSGSLFGNPAMRFGRPAASDDFSDGTCFQKFWYHFSTSVVDLFFWKVLHAFETGVAMTLGRVIWPEYSDTWWVLQFIAELALFAAISILGWWLVSVRFCWCIYHDKVPLENPFYSGVIMRWFNANKIRKVFKPPFHTEGTMWHATMMRAFGTQVGKRFFSPNQDAMIDPIFGRVGDDVTIDYDAQVRQHSFEDNLLKWGPNFIGSGTSILQGGMVAMSDCGQNVALMRGAVTWKGQTLEPGLAYDGAPCVVAMSSEELHESI